MRKEDLRTGMACKLRNGITTILLKESTGFSSNIEGESMLLNVSSFTYLSLEGYNENLTYRGNGGVEYDIMEVYMYGYVGDFMRDIMKKDFDLDREKLLFKRQEEANMTIKEIEGILGYSIKIVKEGN